MAVAKVVEADSSLEERGSLASIEQLRGWAAEWYNPEMEDDDIQGRLVEIRNLSGRIFAGLSGDCLVDGTLANGKRGRAALQEDGSYMVETIDGEYIFAPRENLVICLQSRDEAQTQLRDSFVWDDGSFPFGLMALIIEGIHSRGYCIISTPGAETHSIASIANNMQVSAQPKPDFAGALGLGFGEEFTWLNAGDACDISSGPVNIFCNSLAPYAFQEFGFVATSRPAYTLVRKLNSGAIINPVLDFGEDTHDFLDFVQRRRLCMIHLLEGRAEVELSPRQSGAKQAVTVQLEAQSLFVFRHDAFAYSIYSQKSPAVALQSWIVKEFSQVQIVEVVGAVDEVMEIIGASGQAIRGAHEIHITSAAVIGAGDTRDLDSLLGFYHFSTDGYVMIPYLRWDMDLYYHPEYEGGLSVTKHSGLCDTEHLCHFDNAFFGIDLEAGSKLTFTSYKIIELSYEALHDAGYTKDSLRGQYISHYNADNTRDLEGPLRMQVSIDSQWTSYYTLSQVVSWKLGLTGNAMIIDTACSSGNVALNCLFQEMTQDRDAKEFNLASKRTANQCITGLASGSCPILGPAAFVGLSQGRMLGKLGRCETFNDSASGFARGEGFAVLVAQNMNEIKTSIDQLMAAIGGNINQDGRSASLTAPNGPSQSQVIKASHCAARINPGDVSITELHGTGTALGDPVETGSTRNVMTCGKNLREAPIANCAGKSNTGHTELCAGIFGFLKAMTTYRLSVTPSNVHLRILNKNIEDIGYPALWHTESVDVGLESFIQGVSSFGFGGTNARMEFWGRCRQASRKVSPFSMLPDGSGAIAHLQHNQGLKLSFDKLSTCLVACLSCGKFMCLLCKEALDESTARNHHCSLVRVDSDSYDVCSDCYKGDYVRGMVPIDSSGMLI